MTEFVKIGSLPNGTELFCLKGDGCVELTGPGNKPILIWNIQGIRVNAAIDQNHVFSFYCSNAVRLETGIGLIRFVPIKDEVGDYTSEFLVKPEISEKIRRKYNTPRVFKKTMPSVVTENYILLQYVANSKYPSLSVRIPLKILYWQ